MARSSHRLLSIVALCLAGSSSLACSSSSDDPSGNGGGGNTPAACTSSTLQIEFSKMYSRFGGSHTFKIPAIAVGIQGGAVTWSADKEGFVDIETDNATGQAIFTTLKAGTVNIQANAGDLCGTAPLTIAEATDA